MKKIDDTYVRIFDTTLRDGEQSPGNSMNPDEKLRIARRLAEMKVDVIEAGFPASSPGDFDSVQQLAKQIKGSTICGLARANEYDVDQCAKAVAQAESSRIHTFIATSAIHMEKKLHMQPQEVLDAAAFAVQRARKQIADVEFSAEDATRSDWDFLAKIYQVAIDAGATTLNIPDTVGYTVPEEYARLITFLGAKLKYGDDVVLSVHCHNDLGLAVANSLSAVVAGARQIECTINGIGERAGNTALEEVVMALRVRNDIYGLQTGIDTTKIVPTSRFLSQITGMLVQPNKAIVGDNAFAHEAGIHQHGMLEDARTYEIMTPADVGLSSNKLVLGKHSGRHAFRDRLEQLGFTLNNDDSDRAFRRFKVIADQKKDIFDEDLLAIVADEIVRIPTRFELVSVNVSSGTQMHPAATVSMMVDGALKTEASNGDGPVDAALNAISVLTATDSRLTRYIVNAITGGTDAQGEVTVRIENEERIANGQGADPDIVIASAKAYINALNKLAIQELSPESLKVVGP